MLLGPCWQQTACHALCPAGLSAALCLNNPSARGCDARREVKSAYDVILKQQAGYAPPPPGTGPSADAHRAWAQAHSRASSSGTASSSSGPFGFGGGASEAAAAASTKRPITGPFGGYRTEWQFYRALMSGSSNPALLVAASLVVIPAITGVLALANGRYDGFWFRLRSQGIYSFASSSSGSTGIGGGSSGGASRPNQSPYAVAGLGDIENSYIYKYEKYSHLRKRPRGGASDNSSEQAAGGGAVS